MSYVSKIYDDNRDISYDIVGQEDGLSYVESLYDNNPIFTVNDNKLYIKDIENSDYDDFAIAIYESLDEDVKSIIAPFEYGDSYKKGYVFDKDGESEDEFSMKIFVPSEQLYYILQKSDNEYTLTEIGTSLISEEIEERVAELENDVGDWDEENSITDVLLANETGLVDRVESLEDIVGTGSESGSLSERVLNLENNTVKFNNTPSSEIAGIPITGDSFTNKFLKAVSNDGSNLSGFEWGTVSGGGGGGGSFIQNYEDLQDLPKIQSNSDPAVTFKGTTVFKTVNGESILGSGNIAPNAQIKNYPQKQVISSSWYYGTVDPTEIKDLNNGDIYLYIQ